LYYKHRKAEALPYPNYDESLGATVLSMSINDLGVIVGALNVPSEFNSGLYRFYTDGTQATAIGDTFNFIETINDKNQIANTQAEATCCHATITSAAGQSTVLWADPLCSTSNWINDRNDLVGAYGCTTARAYVYSGGAATFLPAPATEATGINDAGDIIGTETSGIFLYKNAVLYSISPDIRPRGDYSVLTIDCACFYASYLGGLSERDEFIATRRGQFYLIMPSGKL